MHGCQMIHLKFTELVNNGAESFDFFKQVFISRIAFIGGERVDTPNSVVMHFRD